MKKLKYLILLLVFLCLVACVPIGMKGYPDAKPRYIVTVRIRRWWQTYAVTSFEAFHGSYMLHLYDGTVVYVPQGFTVIEKVDAT